jgi:hypothetical protein
VREDDIDGTFEPRGSISCRSAVIGRSGAFPGGLFSLAAN